MNYKSFRLEAFEKNNFLGYLLKASVAVLYKWHSGEITARYMMKSHVNQHCKKLSET